MSASQNRCTEQWPVERRGLLHAAACEACYSAYDDASAARVLLPLRQSVSAFEVGCDAIGFRPFGEFVAQKEARILALFVFSSNAREG